MPQKLFKKVVLSKYQKNSALHYTTFAWFVATMH